MPWTPGDALSFTHRATTPKLKRMWRDIANKALANGDSEAAAIRQANAAVAAAANKKRKAAAFLLGVLKGG